MHKTFTSKLRDYLKAHSEVEWLSCEPETIETEDSVFCSGCEKSYNADIVMMIAEPGEIFCFNCLYNMAKLSLENEEKRYVQHLPLITHTAICVSERK